MTTTQQVEQSAATLRALKQRFGFSAQMLADRTGLSLTQVGWRLKGKTPLSVGDLAAFADIFEVPIELFLKDEDAALLWVAEHRVRIDAPRNHYGRRTRQHGTADLRIQPSPCMREPAAHRPTISPLVVGLPSAA